MLDRILAFLEKSRDGLGNKMLDVQIGQTSNTAEIKKISECVTSNTTDIKKVFETVCTLETAASSQSKVVPAGTSH